MESMRKRDFEIFFVAAALPQPDRPTPTAYPLPTPALARPLELDSSYHSTSNEGLFWNPFLLLRPSQSSFFEACQARPHSAF